MGLAKIIAALRGGSRGDGQAIHARAARTQEAAARYFETPGRRALVPLLGSGLSTGASMADYYVLHRYINVHRPGRILELGSGRTSVVMAHALQEAAAERPGERPGHLDSMEDLARYHADAKQWCPPELAPFVTFHLSEKVESAWRRGVVSFGYAELPEGLFDLVFVDGPTEKCDGKAGVCGDALRIAERSPDMRFDVLIDNKLSTCRALAARLPEGRVRFDRVLRLGFITAVCGREFRNMRSSSGPLRDGNILEGLGLEAAEEPPQPVAAS